MVLTKFPPIFFDEIFSTKVRLGWVRLGQVRFNRRFFCSEISPRFFFDFFRLRFNTRFSMNFCMIFYFRFFPPARFFSSFFQKNRTLYIVMIFQSAVSSMFVEISEKFLQFLKALSNRIHLNTSKRSQRRFQVLGLDYFSPIFILTI